MDGWGVTYGSGACCGMSEGHEATNETDICNSSWWNDCPWSVALLAFMVPMRLHVAILAKGLSILGRCSPPAHILKTCIVRAWTLGVSVVLVFAIVQHFRFVYFRFFPLSNYLLFRINLFRIHSS